MRRFYSCLCACLFGVVPAHAALELSSATSFPVTFESAPPLKPLAVKLARISGDARLDAIVSSSGYPAYFTCLEGYGDGSFGDAVVSGSLRADAVDIVVGDFNGDGLTDFAAANKGSCG